MLYNNETVANSEEFSSLAQFELTNLGEYLMSQNLSGGTASIKRMQELAKIVKGAKPFVKQLSLSIPSIRGQRPTKSETCESHLKNEGGFNWSLWRLPSVVQVPESVARIHQSALLKDGNAFKEYMESGFLNDGFWYGRWDGDHRKHIWEAAFPTVKETDCHIYPVDTVEIANELFVKIQSLNQKGLTSDDKQINLYYANNPEQIGYANSLAHCGMCIKNSEEGIMPKTATNNTPSTKMRLFVESVAEAGLNETKMACQILVAGLNKHKKKPAWNKQVSPTLIKGLALLFKHRPLAMRNGLNAAITEYIHDDLKGKSQRLMQTAWTNAAGGERHNYESQSVAYGLAILVRNGCVAGGYGGGGHTANNLKIATLAIDLGLEKDTMVPEVPHISCSNCASLNEGTAKFCNACGTAL